MRAAADFRLVGRHGIKSGRKTVVVSVALTGDANRMAGFAVSKAVGGAVVRNRVKRRLRAIVAEELSSLPEGAKVVVRALPPAGRANFSRLQDDVLSALRTSRDKVAV